MVNPTALTKNNAYLKHVFGDRLMIPFLGLNMASSLLLGTEYLKENAPKFNKPIIILHGKQDSVTNYHDSIYFFEKCSR
jgi:alpha-beta hydrolase superfamily lysophospholipase